MKKVFGATLLTVLMLLLVGTGVFADQTVKFTYVDADAYEVFIAGEFNGWDAQATPMTNVGDGAWEAELILAEGSYAYKFVVDGQWVTDPNAEDSVDDGYGGKNSVVHVGKKAKQAAEPVGLSSVVG